MKKNANANAYHVYIEEKTASIQTVNKTPANASQFIGIDGVIKTFQSGKRAERYGLKMQLKYLCCSVTHQLKEELANKIAYAHEHKELASLTFNLNGRFHKSWHDVKSQIRNSVTGDYLSVFEGEKYAFGRYLAKLNPDFDFKFDKSGSLTLTEKIIGVDPSQLVTKVEQEFSAVMDDIVTFAD